VDESGGRLPRIERRPLRSHTGVDPAPVKHDPLTDGTYYGVCPDVQNHSGLLRNNIGSPGDGACAAGATCASDAGFLLSQGGQYVNYWKNIGNANWSWAGQPRRTRTRCPASLRATPA